MFDSAEYLRTNEKENAIDSLEKSADFCEDAEENLRSLKWFIIAFHHATHCFMLLALQETDNSGIWKNIPIRTKSGGIDVFHDDNELISFKAAFKRICKPECMSNRPFLSSPYHVDSVEHLNDRLRNEFMHYRPHSWGIYPGYIFEIAEPVIQIVEFLCFKSGRCQFSDEQSLQILQAIQRIKRMIPKLSTNLI